MQENSKFKPKTKTKWTKMTNELNVEIKKPFSPKGVIYVRKLISNTSMDTEAYKSKADM